MMVAEKFDKEVFVKGFGLNKKTEDELWVLIDTEMDANRFGSMLKNNTKTEIANAIIDYRIEKLEARSKSFDGFESEYSADSIVALQNLFLRPILKQDVELYLARWMGKGNTLKDLWEAHKKAPHLPMLRHVI